MLKNLKTFYM